MNNEMDNRTILKKLIGKMDDSDTQQMLAYAAGYEAGKISQISIFASLRNQHGKNVPLQVHKTSKKQNLVIP